MLWIFGKIITMFDISLTHWPLFLFLLIFIFELFNLLFQLLVLLCKFCYHLFISIKIRRCHPSSLLSQWILICVNTCISIFRANFTILQGLIIYLQREILILWKTALTTAVAILWYSLLPPQNFIMHIALINYFWPVSKASLFLLSI